MNLRDEFLSYCAEDPAATAVRDTSPDFPVMLSRSALLESAIQVARQLHKAGVKKADKVLLALPTEATFLQWFWGAQLLGAVAVPVEPLFSDRRKSSQLEHLHRLIALTQAKILVVSAKCALTSSDVPQVLLLWEISGQSELTDLTAVPDPKLNPTDYAIIQFSSGSTGHPKGCMLSHRAVCTNASAWIEMFGYRSGEATFNWMPLYHDFGLMIGVIAPVFGRMTSMLMRVESFISSPTSWLRRMSEVGPVHTAGPSSSLALVLSRLARRTPQALGLQDIRSVICAAEPIYPLIVEKFIELTRYYGFRADSFFAGYGMAETTVFASAKRGLHVDYVNDDGPIVGSATRPAPPTNFTSAFVNLGRAMAGGSFRAVDDRGRALPDRHIGHLQLSSPCLMDRYLLDPEQTDAVLRNGWYATGDIGYLVAGEFHFVTRSKDLIAVAGRKFAPADIDHAVSMKLGIPDGRVASFGYINSLATEGIIIAVETRSDNTKNVRQAAGIACFERTGIMPASVITCPIGTIPKTSSGKVRRHALRRLLDHALPGNLEARGQVASLE